MGGKFISFSMVNYNEKDIDINAVFYNFGTRL
jgi:hypothetical protein